MADDEEKEKPESIWKFYFQARWQTVMTTHFLIIALYMSLFYVGNIWNAIKFAFFTFITSTEMLGLDFALWGIIFEISVVIPFLASWYAILLLPKIWRSPYTQFQKSLLTLLMIIVIPMIIIITDTVARFSLETGALREFVDLHHIFS